MNCVWSPAPAPTAPIGRSPACARRSILATPCSGLPWQPPCWRCSSTSACIRHGRSTVTTMNPTLAGREPKRGRGRLQLLLIFAVVLGPMLLASAMYRFGFWVPQTRSYDGVLIANGQDRAAIGVTAADSERRWELLVTAP